MTVLTPRVLDTDIMIDLQHHHPAALFWFSQAPPNSLVLPGHGVMELYQAAQNNAQLRSTDAQLTRAGLSIIWPDHAQGVQAIANFRRFHLSHSLGLIDSLIGATALSLGVPLCTFNIKHFRHIPGLVTEQPYVR